MTNIGIKTITRKVLSAFPGISSLVLEPAVAQTSHPDIVIVFMDDMGYGDLGSYGSALNARPAMDALANAGSRFTHFYATQSVCSASRVALMTGCYPNSVGISGALFPNAPRDCIRMK